MSPDVYAKERTPSELDNLLDRVACPDVDTADNPETFSLSLEIELACLEHVERERSRLAAKAEAEQTEAPGTIVIAEEVPDHYYDDLVLREKNFALTILVGLVDLEASMIEEASEARLSYHDESNPLDVLPASVLLEDKFIAIVPDFDRVRGNNDDTGESILRPGWAPTLHAAQRRLQVRLEVGGGVSTRPLKNLTDGDSHKDYRNMHNGEFTVSTSDSAIIHEMPDDHLTDRNRGAKFDHDVYEGLSVEEKKALQRQQREDTWVKYQALVGHLLKENILHEELPNSGVINEKVLVWNDLIDKYPNGHFLFMDDDPFATTLVEDHPRFRVIHVNKDLEARLANDWRYVFEKELAA
ncbi:MAG TPA: hypothetical protein VLH38_02885 [Patescibacteria group bacterium]|nr:hypothetical protein [Patescibacteria group bacterium]